MKKNNILINPLFDTWCIYALIVIFMVIFFCFLIIKSTFMNFNWMITIFYFIFALLFVVPFFVTKPRINRILLISKNNNDRTIWYQDDFKIYKLTTNNSNSVRLLINIFPYYFRGGMTTIYTSATIFIANNESTENAKKYFKTNINNVVEDKYNNKHLEVLISFLKDFSDFSYEIKTSEDYHDSCENIKNEIINYIENNVHSKLLAKMFKINSIIGSIFLYFFLGFIMFCSISMLMW